MKEVSTSNFGLVIAYLLPGFVTLIGVSFFSETVRIWLTVSPSDAPTVGGFLYVTLASLTAGLTVSTIRWAVVDTIHHHTGIRQPSFDFSKLQSNVAGFTILVDDLYRYYQFYGGFLVATAFTFVAFTLSTRSTSAWTILLFVATEFILWIGSRDTLRKYYHQGGMLLGEATDVFSSANNSKNGNDKWLLNSKISMRRLRVDRSNTCTSLSQTAGGTEKNSGGKTAAMTI